MIPLYGAQAVGGNIYSLDDPSVVKDGAALAGTGGTAFTPFFLTTPFSIAFDLGWNRLRHFLQRIAHLGSATVRVTGYRDGLESGVQISRSVALSDVGVLEFPLAESGSDFQLKVEVTAYSAELAFGNSQVYIVPKRRFR